MSRRDHLNDIYTDNGINCVRAHSKFLSNLLEANFYH